MNKLKLNLIMKDSKKSLTFILARTAEKLIKQAVDNKDEWDRIKFDIYRIKVKGGWVIDVRNPKTFLFITDPEHEWVI